MRTRLLAVGLLLAALTGCSDTVDTAVKVRDCAALARDAAAAGLDRAPSLQEAEDAVRRLDERVDQLSDPDVKSAASTLRDRLNELTAAARRGDPAEVQQAVARAREAAEAAARTCGLPVEQFRRS